MADMPKIRSKFSTYKYCYIIRERGTDDLCFHKIGLARDIKARLNALQNANGRPLDLVACFRPSTHSGAIAFERRILSRFADRRQCGEWLFGPLSETLAFAADLRKPFLSIASAPETDVA